MNKFTQSEQPTQASSTGDGAPLKGFTLRSFTLESGRRAQCVLFDDTAPGAGVDQSLPEGTYPLYLTTPAAPQGAPLTDAQWQERRRVEGSRTVDADYPPLPEGVKARFKCEDCGGTGYTGEMIPGGDFQPPEPVGCASCNFTGWWAECEAYSADQMHAYLDADRARHAPQGGMGEQYRSAYEDGVQAMAASLRGILDGGACESSDPSELAEVARRLSGQAAPAEVLGKFSRSDLSDVADSLDAGYEREINVGQASGQEPGDGDTFVESTTAYAARFIRAFLATPAASAPISQGVPVEVAKYRWLLMAERVGWPLSNLIGVGGEEMDAMVRQAMDNPIWQARAAAIASTEQSTNPKG